MSGNLGDRSKEFRFDVILRNTGGVPYTGEVAYAYSDGRTGTLAFEAGGALVRLKDGETITLSELPGSLTYTITEWDADANGYATSYTVNGGDSTTGRSVSGSMTNHQNIVFANVRQANIPTGVSIQTHLFLAALPILGLAAILLSRKRRYDEIWRLTDENTRPPA